MTIAEGSFCMRLHALRSMQQHEATGCHTDAPSAGPLLRPGGACEPSVGSTLLHWLLDLKLAPFFYHACR